MESATPLDEVRRSDLVCVKVRNHGHQERFVMTAAASWIEVCGIIRGRIGDFEELCLQSARNEDGNFEVGSEPITDNMGWAAAVTDHSAGKWTWDEEADAFLPAVLLECKWEAEQKRSTGALKLDNIVRAGDDVASCVESWASTTDDLNTCDIQGRTALMLVVIAGSSTAAEALLRRGACTEVADADGYCALHYAAMGDDADCVRILLAARAAIDTAVCATKCTRLVVTSIAGQTALHLACERKARSCASLLLDTRSDPAAEDSRGSRPNLQAVSLRK